MLAEKASIFSNYLESHDPRKAAIALRTQLKKPKDFYRLVKTFQKLDKYTVSLCRFYKSIQVAKELFFNTIQHNARLRNAISDADRLFYEEAFRYVERFSQATSFWAACEEGNLILVKMFYEKLGPTFPFGNEISTPLHTSVHYGHVGLVKWFMANKFSPNVHSIKYGTTPLHIAAALGNMEMFKILTEAGGDINKPDLVGLTPAKSAYERELTSLSLYVLALGAKELPSHEIKLEKPFITAGTGFASLPNDVKRMIFNEIPLADRMLTLSRVCSNWRRLVLNNLEHSYCVGPNSFTLRTKNEEVLVSISGVICT